MEQLFSFHPVYTDKQRKLIDEEFERIKNDHFLDHAGGTLYSEKQIENISSELKSSLLCNPHGGNIPSQKTEDAVDIMRYRILQHFHTNSEEYSLIFTANTTASLKLVAENFEYNGGLMAYLEDNHTSVLGMRSFSETSKCIKVEDAWNILGSSSPIDVENFCNTNSLFVYPAQSNFSGTKYPLEWVERVQNCQLNSIEGFESNKWFVLLDAANFVGTNPLDLSSYKPDFVTFSFYKIFGYPTGLGALLVRRQSGGVLRKKYYGGGTVSMVLARENEAVLKTSLTERFEDGSLPYLSISSLNEGFQTFSRMKLTMKLISQHTFNLARYLHGNLSTLHHRNGEPVAILYHDTNFEHIQHQGGIVNFNLLRENGRFIGYSEVMHMASLYKIHLRTGCSCNPGACQRHLRLSTEDVKKHFQAGHVCGDQNDLVDGAPTGSVRISFGYMSRKEDADALLKMITNCFVQKPAIRKLPVNWKNLQENYKNTFKFVMEKKLFSFDETEDRNVRGMLKQIFLYPIKSCGPFSPQTNWKISNYGLEYDRKWMIVNGSGSCLTQKQCPEMCLIKPIIDLRLGVLKLTFPGEESMVLPLHDSSRRTFDQCESKVCRDRVKGYDCGNEVSRWLCRCLGYQNLRLTRQMDNHNGRINRKGEQLQLSFANESQYLMVNLASVKWLRDRVKEEEETFEESLESMTLRFRPNIVIDFREPFVENNIEVMNINGINFKTVGCCTRCQMICINQVNAEKTREPLITLAREFGGKVKFGVYLGNVDSGEGRDTLDLQSLVLAKGTTVSGGDESDK